MADEGGILSKVSLPSLTQVETVDYDHPAHIPACPVSGCAKGLFCEQICYGALLYTSAQGLLSDALVGSFDRPVILDSFIFVVSLVLLRQTFAKVNYAKLDGLEVNSLARDAGDWALAGEVPLTSKDGKYQVATFAGGCFWGTELHFQRMPGVIATCVGYLAHSCVRACMFGVGPMIANVHRNVLHDLRAQTRVKILSVVASAAKPSKHLSPQYTTHYANACSHLQQRARCRAPINRTHVHSARETP
jgi:hypothetical protein